MCSGKTSSPGPSGEPCARTRFVVFGPVWRSAVDADVTTNRRQLIAQRSDRGLVLLLEEQYGRRGVAQHVEDLGRREPEIDRCDDERRDLADAVDLEVFRAVHRQNRDTVLAAHSPRVQCTCQTTRAFRVLPERLASLAEDLEQAVAVEPRVALDEVLNRVSVPRCAHRRALRHSSRSGTTGGASAGTRRCLPSLPDRQSR